MGIVFLCLNEEKGGDIGKDLPERAAQFIAYLCKEGKPFVRMGLLESPDSSTVYIMYTDKAKGPCAAKAPGQPVPANRWCQKY